MVGVVNVLVPVRDLVTSVKDSTHWVNSPFVEIFDRLGAFSNSFLISYPWFCFDLWVASESRVVLEDSMYYESLSKSLPVGMGPSLGIGSLPVRTQAFSPVALLLIKLFDYSSNYSRLYRNSRSFRFVQKGTELCQNRLVKLSEKKKIELRTLIISVQRLSSRVNVLAAWSYLSPCLALSSSSLPVRP